MKKNNRTDVEVNESKLKTYSNNLGGVKGIAHTAVRGAVGAIGSLLLVAAVETFKPKDE